MRYRFLYAAMALLAAASMASCDEKTEYIPAAPVAADCWGVYFDGANESEFVKEVDDEPVVEITLKRTRTDGELTVPLEKSETVGDITVPESVTFAAGQEAVTISMTYSGFPEIRPKVVLSIPEEYTDPYTKKKGFSRQLVSIKKTEVVVDNIQMYDGSDGTTKCAFSDAKSQIKWYLGENKFIYTNFFGSGLDLIFRIDTEHGGVFDPDNLMKCGGGIEPLSNYYIEEGDEDGWYLSPLTNPDHESLATFPGVEDNIYFYGYSSKYNASYVELYFYDSGFDCGYAWFNSVLVDDGDYTSYIAYFNILDEYKKK